MLVSMSLVLLVTTHWKYFVFFFFQAEDGIRDIGVTGVQTCALPISSAAHRGAALPGALAGDGRRRLADQPRHLLQTGQRRRHRRLRDARPGDHGPPPGLPERRQPVRRSEERRVGKEGRSRWSPYH